MQLWKNGDPDQGRDPVRIASVLSTIKLVWSKNPSLRLGQLLYMLASKTNTDLFYIDDDILVGAAEDYLNETKSKTPYEPSWPTVACIFFAIEAAMAAVAYGVYLYLS